jgi:segregation and condensation protein B
MPSLEAKIEALLAVSPRPLSVKKIAELADESKDAVREAAAGLAETLKARGSGLTLVRVDDELRMGSASETKDVVEKFVKDETTGELTRPQLETLTVVAYRGPVGKAELEQIRGVNCTIILRNLMMRGLVDEESENGLPAYRVSMDFMRFLGAGSIGELPDYETLRRDKRIEDILEFAAKEENHER